MFVEKLSGHGDLNFVLIHNAGGSHQFFTHQVAMLKKHGDVLCLDLPGHGESGSAQHGGIEETSVLISEICREQALSNVCLIGLNNGGNIALDIASKALVPVERLVLIDPPLFMDEKFVGEVEDFINTLNQVDCEPFIKGLVDALFVQTSKANKQIAFDAFNSADKPSLQAMFRSLIKWDVSAATVLQKINCPTLSILTDEHHCRYQQLKQAAPSFELAKVNGSKCWATLEVPEQVNAMIERFLVIGNE
jgi:pimeloyl-ACP methyl ester carboxylesterase